MKKETAKKTNYGYSYRGFCIRKKHLCECVLWVVDGTVHGTLKSAKEFIDIKLDY